MPVTHQAAHLFSNTNLLLTWPHSLFNEIRVPSGDRFDRHLTLRIPAAAAVAAAVSPCGGPATDLLLPVLPQASTLSRDGDSERGERGADAERSAAATARRWTWVGACMRQHPAAG